MRNSRAVVAFCLACLTLPGSAVLAAQQKSDDDEDEGTAIVRSVSFRGNKAIDDGTLRLSIATEQASWPYRFRLTRWLGIGYKPPFDAMEFRRDVLRIQALYGVRGFPDARVDTIVTRKERDVSATFVINEGEPIRVDSLRLIGIPPDADLEELREASPLQAGGPFDRLAFQTAVTTLTAFLRNAGYAFARVTGGFRASDDARTVAVELTAVPGPRARIATIDVVGTEKIDDRVVLQTLGLAPGAVFSDSALHHAQIELQRSELFRQVTIQLVDSIPENPNDSLVNVRVRVQLAESPLRRARLSAGYGTLDCFRTAGTIDLFNFQGDGRRLELNVRMSQIGVGEPFDADFEQGPCPLLADEDTSRLKLNYNVSATLHDPLLFSKSSSAMATLFAERYTEFQAYLRESFGGEVTLERRITRALPFQISYLLSYGRTVAAPATFCALLDVCVFEDMAVFSERRRRSVIALQLVREGTNSLLDPTQGRSFNVELRWAPRLLGSDELMRFTRFSAGLRSFHTIPRIGVVGWRVMGGVVGAPTSQLTSGPSSYVPTEERFYAGGANTVRGFDQNQLGPVVYVLQGSDSTIRTSATGGTFMAMANVEARVPLPIFAGRLFGAVFVDMGMVSERDNISFDGWRVTPGVGLRIASFLGPIRLDVGYNPHEGRAGPLYQEVGTELQLVKPDFEPQLDLIDRFHLHLSIGQAF